MKYFTLAIVSFACLLQQIESHSWLDCTKDVGTGLRTGVNDCQGFARGYPGRVAGSNIDRVMTYRIQPGIDGQNGPICAPNQQTANYSSTYYMASARPGETLRMRWTPNGHQLGAGQNPQTYVIHWTGTPNTQLTTRLQLTEANKLAGPFKFDETCYCDNCAGDPCYGSFTIPPSTAPGIYSFIWYWVFDRNPTGSGEEYTTCFDVKVTGTQVTNTPTSQAPQTTQRTTQATSQAPQTTQRTSQATSQTRTSQPQTTQRTSQSSQAPQTTQRTRTSEQVQTSEVENSEIPTDILATDQITTSAETGSASVLYNLFPVVCIYVATLLL